MRVLLAEGQAWHRSALRLLLENTPNIEVVGEVADVAHISVATVDLRPDVIMMEWALPGLTSNSGRRRLIATLRGLLPDAYVLVLLGKDVVLDAQMLAGADAYVSKSQPPERLLAVLQRITTHCQTGCTPRRSAQQRGNPDS